MRRQLLGNTGIELSRLGFGCAKLTHTSQYHAIAILEQALILGITHFDVARAYGFGQAERILGRFLRGKRDRVTVATKVGLQPSAGLVGHPTIVRASKRILAPFPKLLNRVKQRAGDMVERGVFAPNAVARSLQTSLRELGTDYVDVLLLHEATLTDVSRQDLLAFLQRQVARGTIRSFGVASNFQRLRPDSSEIPDAYRVQQFNDNAVNRNAQTVEPRGTRGMITHSVFEPAEALNKAISARPDCVRRFSQLMDVELRDPKVVHRLLLQYALASNPDGVILFSTTNPTHLAANIQEAEAGLSEPSQILRFTQFVDEVMKPKGILLNSRV